MNNHLFDSTQGHKSTHQNVEAEASMEFKKYQAETICLSIKDIDTDMIMPAQFLKVTTKEGLGKHVFFNLRKSDPNFPQFSGQSILVAGQNFGCGSSREHAPWGLKDAGIDVIIASDFADIFKGNAEKNGILPVVLPEAVVQKFLKSGERLSVDLQTQTVTDSDETLYKFEISEFSKKRLLEGLSDMDYLLEFQPKIHHFDDQQKAFGL